MFYRQRTKTSRNDSRLTFLGTSKQRWWTHLWHFVHWIELQSTCSPQTPQGPTFETLLFFPNNNCIAFVLSTFTLRPFLSTAFFHLPYLSITSINDSPHKTRSSAYNNSINEPSLTSSIRTWKWAKLDSKQTLDGHQLSQKMNLIVPNQLRQQLYNFYKETQPHLQNILGHPSATKQNENTYR